MGYKDVTSLTNLCGVVQDSAWPFCFIFDYFYNISTHLWKVFDPTFEALMTSLPSLPRFTRRCGGRKERCAKCFLMLQGFFCSRSFEKWMKHVNSKNNSKWPSCSNIQPSPEGRKAHSVACQEFELLQVAASPHVIRVLGLCQAGGVSGCSVCTCRAWNSLGVQFCVSCLQVQAGVYIWIVTFGFEIFFASDTRSLAGNLGWQLPYTRLLTEYHD